MTPFVLAGLEMFITSQAAPWTMISIDPVTIYQLLVTSEAVLDRYRWVFFRIRQIRIEAIFELPGRFLNLWTGFGVQVL